MKSRYKILGVLLLASIYGFGVGAVGRSMAPSEVVDSSQGNYFSVAKTSLFCHVPQPESSFEKVQDYPAPSPNTFFTDNVGVQRLHDLLLRATVRHYLNFSINFLVRHRKADLIFPFHYFW